MSPFKPTHTLDGIPVQLLTTHMHVDHDIDGIQRYRMAIVIDKKGNRDDVPFSSLIEIKKDANEP